MDPHSPANPAEDVHLTSAFDNFIETFNLPAKHMCLRALRKESEEAGNWWVEEIIKLANKGTDKKTRRARLAVMNGEALDEGHRMGHKELKALARIVSSSCV